VAHICNPSYLGGRDQKDHGSKPAQANSSARPYLKKPFAKTGLVEIASGEGPEFKPQYHTHKTKLLKAVCTQIENSSLIRDCPRYWKCLMITDLRYSVGIKGKTF
jgi:hypothetical protein